MSVPVPPNAGPATESHHVAANDLVADAKSLFDGGCRLASVAAHDDGPAIRIVYLFTSGPPARRVELHVHLEGERPEVPTLAALSFPASRFEREFHDLFGIVPAGHPFLRPLVLHQHWPRDWHPMRREAGPPPPMLEGAAPFPFGEVEGEGVFEIPVGPVHAGLIEPGHFRFSVVGETILKMKARLWFLHRGMERLFEGRAAADGVPFAERLSGDTAVGHNLAFCLAVEEACRVEAPGPARSLRALLLELERVYNHVADIGALCNDVGFGIAQARALVLRERLLRLNQTVTGHRLLRGAIRPGETSLLRLPEVAELREIEGRFEELVELASASTVVMDRFRGTAILAQDDAAAMGTLGVVARSSALAVDERVGQPIAELGASFAPAVRSEGDVLARFSVRVAEVRTSLGLIGELAGQATSLSGRTEEFDLGAGSGVGIVEGWRGAIVHRVEVGAGGLITRCKVVDPSFLNWPALSVALADTIVPDFPLANKSFNLSYAGNDL